jgi:hypothetical protein
MVAKLAVYQKDIHMRKPGAKQKLTEFIADTENNVKKILIVYNQCLFIKCILTFSSKHAKDCRIWFEETSQQRWDDIAARKERRLQAFVPSIHHHHILICLAGS